MRIHTEQIAGGAYFQSKPTAANGLVFFGTPSRFVYALDASSGKEVWKFELGAAVSGAPEYHRGRIYIGQQGGENDFYCLDAKTGRPIWSQAVGWVWGSPCVDGGQVFVPEIEGWANCLDADTGAILWRYRTGRSLCTEPFVNEDTAFFGGWDRNLYAFDRETGHLRWSKNLSGGSDSGAPAIANGRIYLPVGGSQFRCVDAATGKTIWRYEMANTNFNVTPAYHEGRVYISILRGLGMGGIPVVAKVIALDAGTGKELWSHVGGGLTGPVIGTDNRVFVASTTSPFLYCLDGKGNPDGTAKLHWAYRMGNKVEESVPCLYGDSLYILSCDGYLHAVK
jgi:outer membrane protein assembly factor BamB